MYLGDLLPKLEDNTLEDVSYHSMYVDEHGYASFTVAL